MQNNSNSGQVLLFSPKDYNAHLEAGLVPCVALDDQGIAVPFTCAVNAASIKSMERYTGTYNDAVIVGNVSALTVIRKNTGVICGDYHMPDQYLHDIAEHLVDKIIENVDKFEPALS